MPFGPMNAPSFYTSMIRQYQDEWTLLFRLECNRQKYSLGDENFGQPPRVCSILPYTNYYVKSCTDAYLPSLEFDPEFTVSRKVLPLIVDCT